LALHRRRRGALQPRQGASASVVREDRRAVAGEAEGGGHVTRIGFIGTGLMGTKMVNCLIDAGHELTVNDVVREAAAEVCGRGAAWAASPREVGEKTEVVFTSLPGPDEVESVFFHESRGVLAGLR